MQHMFIPDENSNMLDVPTIEEARADFAPGYSTSVSNTELQGQVLAELSKLGAGGFLVLRHLLDSCYIHLDTYNNAERDEFIYLVIRQIDGAWRVTVAQQAYDDDVYDDGDHFYVKNVFMSTRKMLEVLNDWPDISWIEEWC